MTTNEDDRPVISDELWNSLDQYVMRDYMPRLTWHTVRYRLRSCTVAPLGK